MKFTVLCISVRDSERRKEFSLAAERHGVQFSFADAVTPDDIRMGRTPSGMRVDLTDLRWTLHERSDPRRQKSPLLFTEIACAYSHVSCWQWAARNELDFLVVFEDDAEIVRPLHDADFSGAFDLKYLSDRMPSDVEGAASGYGCGTEGYLLTRSGVFKALRLFSTLYMPIDLQLIAHSKGQIQHGHGLSTYRRADLADYYLDARVSSSPVCRHQALGSSVA
jgi:GR25 family glycosyltransferase involved in LPS biosynthesis